MSNNQVVQARTPSSGGSPGQNRIYLDHNATSPLRKRVRAAMINAMELGGNPSSIHAEGRRARALIERSRETIAAVVGAEPEDVLFTSGGTEANMTALSPGIVAKNMSDWQRALLFVSAIEHPAIARGGRFAASQIRVIPVLSSGIVDLGAFIALLEENGIYRDEDGQPARPFMVSVMLANNETGIIQPVTEIAALVLERGGFMHCDGVQALGRMPFDMASTSADLLTIAAHKIGGPKGVGALIGPGIDNVLQDPLLTGGGQERRRRAGTEDVVAIAGFATAAEIACEELADREMIRFLRDRMERKLTGLFPGLQIFGQHLARLDNTSFLAIPGVDAQSLVMALDLDGIAISAGTACSSGKVKRSSVLDAMGFDEKTARCAFRVSFGPENWRDDVDRLVVAVKSAVAKIRKSHSLSDADLVMARQQGTN